MTATLVEPAFLSHPPYVETLGPEVAQVCELAGFAPDPEQRLALDAVFGLTEQGTPAADEAALIAPRQNIKTGFFKQCALGWLFVTRQRLIIWSAHEFSTAQEAHRDLKELVTGSDWLRKRVKKITDGNGDEGIELLTGQRVKFKARTKTGGRGLTGDKVVLDEAFALLPRHMGSLVPTMAARPHGQIVYGSSAGMATSDVLRAIRDRGRAGGDPGLVYLEWCDDLPGECELGDQCTHIVGTPGCRLDDERRAWRANSQLGRRITLTAVQRERRSLPPEEYARERLGWWDEPEEHDVELALDQQRVSDSEDATSQPVGQIVLAIDVAPDRTTSLSAAGWRADGRKHLEEIRTAAGTGWVVDVLLQVVQNYDPAAVVLDERVVGLLGVQMRAAGIEPTTTNSLQLAQASTGLADDLNEDRVRWRGGPALVAAAKSAVWRRLGDGKAFDRRGAAISPLVSVALADWCLETLDRPPADPPPQPEPIPAARGTTGDGFDLNTAGF